MLQMRVPKRRGGAVTQLPDWGQQPLCRRRDVFLSSSTAPGPSQMILPTGPAGLWDERSDCGVMWGPRQLSPRGMEAAGAGCAEGGSWIPAAVLRAKSRARCHREASHTAQPLWGAAHLHPSTDPQAAVPAAPSTAGYEHPELCLQTEIKGNTRAELGSAETRRGLVLLGAGPG